MSKINLLEKIEGKTIASNAPIHSSSALQSRKNLKEKAMPSETQHALVISDLEDLSSSRNLLDLIKKEPEQRTYGASGILKNDLILSEPPKTQEISQENLKEEEPEKHCPTCKCFIKGETALIMSEFTSLKKTQVYQKTATPYYSPIFKLNSPSQVFRSRLNARFISK